MAGPYTTSRYSGRRRAAAPVRMLQVRDAAPTAASGSEDPLGGGSGGGLPSGLTSRYSGARRAVPTIKMISLQPAPVPVVSESTQSDPLPVLFI
jgi:hypothetical protein